MRRTPEPSGRWLLHAALLVTAVGAFHRDSIHLVARADQLVYLHQTAGLDGLPALLRESIALTRQVGVLSDHLLYRPLLYAVLALERWLWEYRFAAWQATSVLLHMTVVLAVHRYLWTLLKGSGWLATIAALHFAVLRSGIEMVLWHHLAGYLVFCLFAVLAGLESRRFLEAPLERGWARLAAWLLLAAFTFELGSVLAVAMAACIAGSEGIAGIAGNRPRQRVRRRAAIALAAVPAAYAVASATDYVLRLGWPAGGDRGLPGAPPGDGLHALAWWTWTSLVPSGMSLWGGSRLKSSVLPDHSPMEIWINAVAALLAIAFVAWRGATRLRERSPERRRDYCLAATWFAMATAFALLVAFGRGSERGIQAVMAVNTYYAYFFWAFALLGTGHLVGAMPTDAATRWPGWRAAPAGAVLVIGIYFSVRSGLPLIEDMRYVYSAPRIALVERVSRLHALHAQEPGFTFSVSRPCQADEELEWFAPHARVHASTYRLSNVLFPLTARESGGRYLVPCPGR